MGELTLTLLGPPCLAEDRVPLHLRSRKCIALLGYLAVTTSIHSRARLATLFWPELDSKRAHAGLRYTLSWLRKALQNRWLVVDRETIRLDEGSLAAVDVAQFRELLARCRAHGHLGDEICPECLPVLDQAVELCQGEFMAGFTLRDSPGFDEWQSLEAEALRRELAGALERLAEGYTAQGDVERGIAHARRWLELDPLHEPAHRCLMRLYAGCGRRSDAVQQVEACERLLREELGVSPDPETIALSEAIREGRTLSPRLTFTSAPKRRAGRAHEGREVEGVPARPRHNLPPEPTPFIGREEELAHIALLLADPGCRLLSVVGPGGMGKSRLAIRAAADQLPHFNDGVYLVPLASLASSELLASAIMEAIGVPRYGATDPSTQLLNALRDRELLLVLDNFEHLLGGVSLLGQILGEAPGLKLLVTSRERLNLRQEWLLPLRGLDFPEDEEISGAGEEDYAAIELFVRCARPVRPEVSLLSAGPASVARVCQLVEGMPLAIELAAPWVRVMGCESIVRELEGSLDFLTTTLHDMPQRHRSMRAVFDQSWGLLSSEERSVLRELSVLRGGFRREAAEAVALGLGQPPASLIALSALVDRSWLRTPSPDRYEMHELVRQYCSDQLRVGMLESEVGEDGVRESERVRDRHSRYYGAFLQEREGRLSGRGQVQALSEILGEMDNVWAAWQWAVEQGDAETIGKCVEALAVVGSVRGWNHEMSQNLEEAATVLREQLDLATDQPDRPARERTAALLADVLIKQASFRRSLGQTDRAIDLCEESLALLCDVEQDARRDGLAIDAKMDLGFLLQLSGDSARGWRLRQEAFALAEEVGESLLHDLGMDLRRKGQWDEAETVFRRAIDIAEEEGDQLWRTSCLDNLSAVLWAKGEYQRARTLAEECLQIRQELGDRSDVSYSFLRLAEISTALGNYDLAGEYCRSALAIADEIGDLLMKVECLMVGPAMLASALGQHEEAIDLFLEALAIAREVGYSERFWSGALAELGYSSLALGQIPEAEDYLRRALGGAMEAGFRHVALNALGGMASLTATEGEPERATELLGLVLQHPSTAQITKDRTRELLSELESELPPEAFAKAMERGRSRGLEEVAAEILGARRP